MSIIWLSFFLIYASGVFSLLFEHSILLTSVQAMVEQNKEQNYLIQGVMNYGIEYIRARDFDFDIPFKIEVKCPFLSANVTAAIFYNIIQTSSDFKIISIKAYIYDYKDCHNCQLKKKCLLKVASDGCFWFI